jgi:hypothetical protein
MTDKHDHWPFKKRYGLKDIPIGEDTLEVLNDLPMWFTKEESYKNLFLGYEDQKHRRDHWTGEELRLQIMKSERSHEGFPDCLHGYSFGTTNIKFAPDIPIDDLVSVAQRTNHKLQETIAKFQTHFGFKKNALFCVYPPGGFISWHNNANAPAYNFIFTWSEKGQGWFKYWDTEKKEIVTFQDKAGWQCKAGYFGPYAEGNDGLCYHAASTDCLRMTIAFTLDRDEVSKGWQDWIIDDIST